VLGQDYIKTAKSKGISKLAVIMRHAIRNAILPIVSILGTTLSNLVAGSFVIEKIFGIPGLGMFFITSVFSRDYTLIMGVTVFYAMVLVAMMLLVDIAYTLIDHELDLLRRTLRMEQTVYTKDMFKKAPKDNRNAEQIRRPTIKYWADVWRRLKQNKLAMFGLMCLF